MERVAQILSPGGVFVNGDQVAGPTSWHDGLYRRMHEATARSLGSDDREWAAALERMKRDIYASIDEHLIWLREAGLEYGDCYFKSFGFAVVAAWKPKA